MALSPVQAWLAENRVTWKLMFATALVSLTVFNYGFDQTAYSTIQAMDRKCINRDLIPPTEG